MALVPMVNICLPKKGESHREANVLKQLNKHPQTNYLTARFPTYVSFYGARKLVKQSQMFSLNF